MTKIDKLTPEQEAKLIEFRDEWRKIGLATGAANMDAVKPVITEMYAAIGKPAPEFVNARSPMHAILLLNERENQLKVKRRFKIMNHFMKHLREELKDQLWKQRRDCLDYYVWRCVTHQLWHQDWYSLGDHILQQIWKEHNQQLQDHAAKIFFTHLNGSLESDWIASYLFPDAYIKPMYTDEQRHQLNWWATLAQNSFWWYSFEKVCVVCDRPSAIHFDNQNRLHCEDDAAIRFSDGWGVYTWHGVLVSEEIIMQPITYQRILDERNAEIKRVMIERYGEENFIRELGADPLHEDAFGKFYRVDYGDKEPLCLVRVVDPSTDRVYFLQVPPVDAQGNIMERAKQAVAWTFGLSEDEYQPLKET